ncbi:hypothetical protein [Clostridium sp. 'White wine YQ']|uniref:hypothetical protein n=1 Tax=Clostridium sp. 'White wine YQ' TaxID=3027474 RepID=UPI002365CBE2|nr:hypothetical protein [Clostridium sp. 'White wine YQ']MDD7793674.1 hypothetical protein [Clostridium sp. 'White wine YQ']
MAKRKIIYFIILTIFCVLSIFISIKFCDIPILSIIPLKIAPIFIKPNNSDMLLYNLSVGYIVSYMFYLLVNFIPELLDAKEKEKELLRLKCAIHREIQAVIENVRSIWYGMELKVELSSLIKDERINDINNLFRFETIKNISEGIKLSDDSNLATIELSISWSELLINRFNEISTQINIILTRYKSDLKPEIFYELFYLVNESLIVGRLPMVIEDGGKILGKDIFLSECIPCSIKAVQDNIEKTCKIIIDLYNWVNKEYDYLKENIQDEEVVIHKIESIN